VTLTFVYDLEIKQGSRGCRGTWWCVQNLINLSAAVHELACTQTFCPISQWQRIRKSDPVTLTFSRFRTVVKVTVHAKFYQAKCSVSWVIVRTAKKRTPKKTIRSVATRKNITLHCTADKVNSQETWYFISTCSHIIDHCMINYDVNIFEGRFVFLLLVEGTVVLFSASSLSFFSVNAIAHERLHLAW